MKKLIVLAVICFIIGFEAAWLLFNIKAKKEGTALRRESTKVSEELSKETSTASGLVPAGENAIAVHDQAPGTKAVVSMVTLKDAGWVVIHEDKDGAPANILGAQRLDAGTYSVPIEVQLLRSTLEGSTYYAMLHSDDGDKQFDHKQDLPITDSLQNIIMMKFVATSNPTE